MRACERELVIDRGPLRGSRSWCNLEAGHTGPCAHIMCPVDGEGA